MFRDDFKKELNAISAEQELLDRTRSKIATARFHAAEKNIKATAKRKRIARVFSIAGVTASCAIILTAAMLFGSLFSGLSNSKSLRENATEPQSVNATVAEAGQTDAEQPDSLLFDELTFQDKDIRTFRTHEEILSRIKQANEGREYSFPEYDGVKTDEAIGEDFSPAETTAASGTYSETNVQVTGVDEADLIKNDGEHLYYLTYSVLYVFDIRDPENIEKVCELNLSGGNFDRYAMEFFFDSEMDTLSVIGSGYQNDIYYIQESEDTIVGDSKIAADCYFPSGYTTLDTYDVGDPSSPRLIRSFSQEGSYLSSRRIGDTIYLVTSNYAYYYDYENYDVLPSVRNGEGDWSLVPAKDIYIVGQNYVDTFTIVTAIDSRNPYQEPTTQAIAGTGNTVYASLTNLYVTGTVWESYTDDFSFDSETVYSTKVLSFSISNGKLTAKSAGTVPGTVLNQYSIDEYKGYLRVATTSMDENWETSNNIYVLDEKLEVYSFIEKLAPGESIYSVRFNGDRIYLVTFVQVDPLFVIDASNPKALEVLGELKVPGYSNYLHMIGDDMVLGIGNATKSGDGFVTNAGLKISLFDVEDPENPTEKSSLVYGVSYGYSEVQYNPKALLVNAGEGIYGLPVYFDKPAGEYGTDYVSGYLLVKIDSSGNLRHEYLFENINNYGTCRGAFVGDTLFLVSETSIYSFDLDSFKQLDYMNLSY